MDFRDLGWAPHLKTQGLPHSVDSKSVRHHPLTHTPLDTTKRDVASMEDYLEEMEGPALQPTVPTPLAAARCLAGDGRSCVAVVVKALQSPVAVFVAATL